MSNPFRSTLRAFVATALAEPGEHSRTDLAQSFLAANPDMAAAAISHLAETQVGTLIREMCDAEPDGAQMSFFRGLPAAIAVSPGAVKAIEHCTDDDLAIGEQHREDGITFAREKLQQFRQGRHAYVIARLSGETVGDTARRLAEIRNTG